MPFPLVPLRHDDRARFASCGNVVFVCAHDRESKETFDLLGEHLRAVASKTGGKVGLAMIVAHEKGPPPGFVDDAKALLDRCASIVVGASCALQAQGFVASVYRSMGAMLLSLMGKRELVGVHGSVEDACAWLERRLPPGPNTPDLASLVSAAHAVRGLVPAPPAA